MGMSQATDVVIMGCSAGGLGVYLGIDEIADMIYDRAREVNNTEIQVRGLTTSGVFMDFNANVTLSKEDMRFKNNRDNAMVNGKLNYGLGMREVFERFNIEVGANQACIEYAKKKNENPIRSSRVQIPSDCIFATNLGPFIRTPVFTMQVK